MKEIISIFFRRKKEAGIFALCMILFPMSIAYMLTEKYESSCSFMLSAGRFKKPFLPNERDSQTGFVQVTMEDVATEVEMMTSLPVVQQVVAINHLDVFPEPGKDEYLKKLAFDTLKAFNRFLIYINLKGDMSDFDIAVQKFTSSVDIEYVKRTNIINVKWKGSTPEQAQNVINTFIQEYIKQHLRVHGYSEALDIIKSEVDSDYQQVTNMERKIEEYKDKQNLHDIDKEREQVLTNFLEAKSHYESLQHIDPNNIISTNTGLYSNDPSMLELINDLVQAKVAQLDLVSKFGANDRKTLINQQKINALQSIIRTNHLKNLESWRESKIKYENRLSLLDRSKFELDSLQRELNGISDRYKTSFQKYNESLISQAMDEGNVASVRVVQYGSKSSAATYPPKLLLLIISVFFAIFGGIATAFAADKLSTRIFRLKDLEEITNLPVLFTWRFFTKKEIGVQKIIDQEANKSFIAIKKYLSDTAQKCKIHLIASPSNGVGSTFLTREIARFTSFQVLDPVLLLVFNNDEQRKFLAANTLEKVESDVVQYIEKGDDYDSLVIDISNRSIIRERVIKQLIEKSKNLGYSNIIIDIPNDKDDYTFINFLSSIDFLYINIGYDLTDKDNLQRFMSIIHEQSGITPTGCIMNMYKSAIPPAIENRL